MARVKITTEVIISLACEVLSDIYNEMSIADKIGGGQILFKRRIKNKIQEYEAHQLGVKVCKTCGKKKLLSEYYEKSGSRCKTCYIAANKKSYEKQRTKKEDIERRQSDLVKAVPHGLKVKLTSEQQNERERLFRERTRIDARKQYYDSERLYLLKKYLKRHESQLQTCIRNISILEEEMSTSDSKKEINIKSKLIRLNAKKERLEKAVALEKELINNPEKRKEILNEQM